MSALRNAHESAKLSNGAARVRLSRLASSVGLTTQQIRNYVDVGLLPAAHREANGYRIFTAEHAEALVVARTTIDGYGWKDAVAVMAAIHDGDLTAALATIDSAHGRLDHERREVGGLLHTLEGELPPALRNPAQLGIGDVAGLAGVTTATLRQWEKAGLLTPSRERATGYRSYDQRQVVRARVIAMLRTSGYSLAAVREVVDGMREGDPARTRAALRSRLDELAALSRRRAEATAAVVGYLAHRSAGSS